MIYHLMINDLKFVDVVSLNGPNNLFIINISLLTSCRKGFFRVRWHSNSCTRGALEKYFFSFHNLFHNLELIIFNALLWKNCFKQSHAPLGIWVSMLSESCWLICLWLWGFLLIVKWNFCLMSVMLYNILFVVDISFELFALFFFCLFVCLNFLFAAQTNNSDMGSHINCLNK